MIVSNLKVAQRLSNHELGSACGGRFIKWANGQLVEDRNHVFSAPINSNIYLEAPRTRVTVTKLDNKTWQVSSIACS